MVERLITDKAEGKKAMHDTCKYALNAMNRKDDNCPILMAKMTFNIFSHYMSMKKSGNSGVYLSATSYRGIRSALTHLYHVSGKETDQGFKKELSQFMSGMKRLITSNKRQDGISLEEVKEAMSCDVYKTLCGVLHQGEGEEFIFSHTFLTMEWNFMARSNNSVNMHTKHIQWRSDCLILYFGTSKVNQTREISSDPWHLYTNPKNPSICPVLAVAK